MKLTAFVSGRPETIRDVEVDLSSWDAVLRSLADGLELESAFLVERAGDSSALTDLAQLHDGDVVAVAGEPCRGTCTYRGAS